MEDTIDDMSSHRSISGGTTSDLNGGRGETVKNSWCIKVKY